jgi:hypothetical protein
VGGAYTLDTHGNFTGLGNLISGNKFDGVFLCDYFSAGNPVTNNIVQGNFIGTDVTGTKALSNVSGEGVHLEGGASNNTIGGTVPGTGNLISSKGTGQFPDFDFGIKIADRFGRTHYLKSCC